MLDETNLNRLQSEERARIIRLLFRTVMESTLKHGDSPIKVLEDAVMTLSNKGHEILGSTGAHCTQEIFNGLREVKDPPQGWDPFFQSLPYLDAVKALITEEMENGNK